MNIILFQSFSITKQLTYPVSGGTVTNALFNSFSLTGRELGMEMPSYSHFFKSFSVESNGSANLVNTKDGLGYIIRQ